jgi:spermidine/putrescine transport system permease protein
VEQHLRPDHHGLEAATPGKVRLGRRLAPYGLTGPGTLWLVVFFLIPMFAMLVLSLETPLPTVGFKQAGYQFTWNFSQYTQAWSQYHVQFVRSLVYAGIVTLLTLVIGYPVAYWIAFKGGTQKTTYLFLILLPFFVSFVIRSLAWQFLLSSDGIVFSNLERIHVLPQGFHVLGTPTAVISGIAYNSLPFMVLPLYVSLEKIDRRVLEASNDLYGSRFETFRRVVLPLSAPGIFAGILLTFIPSAGDYVNATILGSTQTTMIGNVIQTLYLGPLANYPMAAALSLILMALLLFGIVAYALIVGAESLADYL